MKFKNEFENENVLCTMHLIGCIKLEVKRKGE